MYIRVTLSILLLGFVEIRLPYKLQRDSYNLSLMAEFPMYSCQMDLNFLWMSCRNNNNKIELDKIFPYKIFTQKQNRANQSAK